MKKIMLYVATLSLTLIGSVGLFANPGSTAVAKFKNGGVITEQDVMDAYLSQLDPQELKNKSLKDFPQELQKQWIEGAFMRRANKIEAEKIGLNRNEAYIRKQKHTEETALAVEMMQHKLAAVTPQMIDEQTNALSEKFKDKYESKITIIAYKTKADAEKAKKSLTAKNFAATAKKSNGIEVGWVKDAGILPAEVFKIKKGEISAPFELNQNYFIAFITDKRKIDTTTNAGKEALKAMAKAELEGKVVEEWNASLKKDYELEILPMDSKSETMKAQPEASEQPTKNDATVAPSAKSPAAPEAKKDDDSSKK